MLDHGTTLNQRYFIQEKIGESICRQTWSAFDLFSQSNQSKVVLKFLTFSPGMEWNDLKLFERELNTLRNLDHPLIPEYLDSFIFEDKFTWFVLVYRYIPGSSLAYLIKTGNKFSEKKIQEIAQKILTILIYLHELSPLVLHRDIKPSNLILGSDQRIYLIDFGSVQVRGAIEKSTFTIVGTYGYTPIEQFGGRAVPASDLYALGVTLIHVLTGVEPANLSQHNMRIEFRKNVSISRNFVDWIEILTHPNVEQRFATAREALEVLNHPELMACREMQLRQPANSKIKFEKDDLELNVKIPKRGLRMKDSFIITWMVILYAATIPLGLIIFPFIIFYWLLGLLPIFYCILSAFGRVNLLFGRQQFHIEWRLCGIQYRSLRGYTAIIKDVYPTRKQSENAENLSLGVQIGRQKYHFKDYCAPLSEPEIQWLAQELRDWLILR